jgi:hypothetical protein
VKTVYDGEMSVRGLERLDEYLYRPDYRRERSQVERSPGYDRFWGGYWRARKAKYLSSPVEASAGGNLVKAFDSS